MAEPLTDRQQKLLSFIKRSIQEQGYPPTIREIGEAFGIRSTNGVNDHLKALERKGYLLRGELKSRALSVIEGGMPGPQPPGGRFPSLSSLRKPQLAAVPEAGEVVEGPVVGKVAAGQPILAQENITDHGRIDSFLLGDPAAARKVVAVQR